ncbi:MAG: hypothetical protein ACRD1H_04545 [Vicinamibacterales bacterium]
MQRADLTDRVDEADKQATAMRRLGIDEEQARRIRLVADLNRDLAGLEGHATRMADELRVAAAGSADDLATQDVNLEILRALEMQHWMLRAHLLEQENGLNAA